MAKLKKFLTDRKNSAKAQEWARVLEISTDQIPSYIDQLTPVVLRHDTLVTNHDYKHGKAVPYAALLQAGIAIMVDKDGLPAVKCSCGNPLRPFEGKASKTDVQFKNGNKKWADYRQDRVVVVKPPPGEHEILKLQLVDVHHPDRGIARPVGSDGNQDTSFSTQQKHAVPAVSGLTFAEAIRRLTDAGLGMTYTGDALPADDARVTASQPAEGSEVAWGTSVVLSVRSDSPSDMRRWPGDAFGFRRHECGSRDDSANCATCDDSVDTVHRNVRRFVGPLVQQYVNGRHLVLRRRHRVEHAFAYVYGAEYTYGHERRNGRRYELINPVARFSDQHRPDHPLGLRLDRAAAQAELYQADDGAELDQTHRQQRAAA